MSKDSGYDVDYDAIETFKDEKFRQLLASNPKHINKCKISAIAAIKMMNHANMGVEKGINTSVTGKPIEVMGLMIGRPDITDDGRTMIITDAFPVPAEGIETRVVTDDIEVMNYMTGLADTIEHTRKDRIIGWYHSHPFDVDVHSQCFFSSTDLTTQLTYQQSEKEWLGIVIDPLRSMAKSTPEMMVFRAYPASYKNPVANECPDGTVDPTDGKNKRWGSCWQSYYCLETSYFTSDLSRGLLGVLSKSYLWMRDLSTTPMLKKETKERFADRISGVSAKLDGADSGLKFTSSRSSGGAIGGDGGSKKPAKKRESAMDEAVSTSAEISLELIQGQVAQLSKNMIFNCGCGEAESKHE